MHDDKKKITRNSFHKINKTSNMLELVHSDVSDLHKTLTLRGKKCFITFIDDYTRYYCVY